MKISCPHCGQHFDVDETDVGKDADCTSCGKRFQIKAETSIVSPSLKTSSSVCRCPYCGGEVVSGMAKCCHCGEWISKGRRIIMLALTIAVGGLFLALVITNLFFILNCGKKQQPIVKQQESTSTASTKTVNSPPPQASSVPRTISPTIVVKNFAHPAHSATCVLYKNHREIMRRETTVGMVLFNRVESQENDIFSAEMQYRNGYGTVGKIATSYSRKANQKSEGNVLILEPKFNSDR